MPSGGSWSSVVIASDAKQSIVLHMLNHGLLRRFAPRNDEKPYSACPVPSFSRHAT